MDTLQREMLGDICCSLYRQEEELFSSFRGSVWPKLDTLEKQLAEYSQTVQHTLVEAGLQEATERPQSGPPSGRDRPSPSPVSSGQTRRVVTPRELLDLKSAYAGLRPLARHDEEPASPRLQINGQLTPGSTIEVAGLSDELRRLVDRGETPVWTRMVADEELTVLDCDDLRLRVTAEDVGATLRVDLAGYSATSQGTVLPHRPTLQLLKEKLRMKVPSAHALKVL